MIFQILLSSLFLLCKGILRLVPCLLSSLAILLLTGRPPIAEAEVPLTQISSKLSLSANVRVRGEFWHWFDPADTQDNDYAFVGTVALGGLRWTDDAFDVFIEAQNSALMALPNDAAAPPPQGALGLGAVYFVHNRQQDDTSLFLKQAFLTFKRFGIEGFTLTGGRFNFNEGLEVLTADPTLDWLKTFRISQRLIGSFGWSHVGRSFDGFTASWTRAPVNLTLHASHPTQGGFDLAGNDEMGDIDLLYAAFNLTRPAVAETSDVRLFYIYYSDGRGLLKTDNRPAPTHTEDQRHITINTGGGNWLSVLPTRRGPIDLLAWGVLQGGDWGVQNHHGWAWALEGGWQPIFLPWNPWFRLGYNRSSGDNNPVDNNHDTFFQILPTARLYSFSTFYNLMNNEDGFLQVILRPLQSLVWRTDFHNIRTTAGRDLWYQGAGATLENRKVGFGYVGRPAFGHHDLFQVLETTLSYNWSNAINVNLYYAHVFGGRIVRSLFAGHQADFGYLEVVLRL